VPARPVAVLHAGLARLARVKAFREINPSSAKGGVGPPLMPLSRVSNMRSVHTALEPSESASFRRAVSPTCVGAAATVAGVVWLDVFVTPSPSCRPWLHGRYPLPSYYGGSDSRVAPVEHRRGSLCLTHDAFRPFPLQPPSRRVQSPDNVGCQGWTCALRRRLRTIYAGSSDGLAESSSPSLA